MPRGTGGPGGVGLADGQNDVRAWFRADEGVETIVGSDVTRWLDQSGFQRHAEAIESNRRPNLVTGAGPHASSALRFDGMSHLSMPRPVEDSFTLLAVFSTTSGGFQPVWFNSPALLGGYTPQPCFENYHLGIDGGGPRFVVAGVSIEGTGFYNDGAPHVIRATRVQSSGEMRVFMDGVWRGSKSSVTDSLDCPERLFVGSATATAGYWTGDLFEICAFDRLLGQAELNLVDNYLAVRFGTSAMKKLYDSSTHRGDVAGIGRESSTDFIDRSEGPGILQVSFPSALSDGDYLLWGTDRPQDSSLSEDVPAPYPRRLERTWTTKLTDGGNGDGVGLVTLRFRVGGLYLSTRASDFALLFDDDGLFFDARVVTDQAAYDPRLDAIVFPDVSLGPERFFTLAVKPL